MPDQADAMLSRSLGSVRGLSHRTSNVKILRTRWRLVVGRGALGGGGTAGSAEMEERLVSLEIDEPASRGIAGKQKKPSPIQVERSHGPRPFHGSEHC